MARPVQGDLDPRTFFRSLVAAALGSALIPGRPSVLLVDDDANFRRAVAIALRLDGLDVQEAPTAEAARALLAGTCFTAVVVELLLQDGEAHTLLEALCQDRRHRLAIACSAHPEALDAARERIPGVSCLHKPFPAADLRLLVESCSRPRTAS